MLHNRNSESIETFFEREVVPHVPDTWINTAIRDQEVWTTGRVAHTPPRPLEEIKAEIRRVEKEIMEMLREVAG
jgi:type I restriction enzyme M protein